jgi:ribosome biogenesis GTPase A
MTLLISVHLAPTGTFIHPSLFLLDETVASMANIVNSLPYCESLRSQAKVSIPNTEQDFWNIHKEIEARTEVRHARILVCGLTEVGKSTLINAALGKKIVSPPEHELE